MLWPMLAKDDASTAFVRDLRYAEAPPLRRTLLSRPTSYRSARAEPPNHARGSPGFWSATVPITASAGVLKSFAQATAQSTSTTEPSSRVTSRIGQFPLGRSNRTGGTSICTNGHASGSPGAAILANDRVRHPCDEGRPTGRPSFFSVLPSRSRQRFVGLDFKPQHATAATTTHAANPQVTPPTLQAKGCARVDIPAVEAKWRQS